MSYPSPARASASEPGARRRYRPMLMVTALAVAGTMAVALPSSASASTGCAMRANAYVTRAHLGSLISSSATAKATVCTSRIGVTRRNRLVGADLPQVLHTGVVATRIVTRHSPSGRSHRVTAKARVARVALLDQIRARAIYARATASTRHHHQLIGRTVLLGLRFNGKRVPAHPKRDQTLAIPGLGKIVLNHQVRIRHAHRITIRVTALRLVLGAGNPAHLPAGALIIGHTSASIRLPAHR